MKPSKIANLLITLLSVLALASTAQAAKKKKAQAAPAAEAAEPAPQETAPPPPAEPEPAAPPAPAESSADAAGDSINVAAPDDGNFATRRLTLRKGGLRIEGGPADFTLRNLGQGLSFGKGGKGSDMGVGLGAGVGYGITDQIEVGAVLIPLQLSPNFAYGDIPLYGRYLISETDTMQIVAHGQINFPTGSKTYGTGGYFGISGALGIRNKLSNEVVFDGAAQMGLDFITDNTTFYINVPLVLNYKMTPESFVGLRSGLNWRGKQLAGNLAIPLGVQGGYTLVEGKLDALAWFQFDRFLVPDAPSGVDKLSADFWTLGFGAVFYMDTNTM